MKLKLFKYRKDHLLIINLLKKILRNISIIEKLTNLLNISGVATDKSFTEDSNNKSNGSLSTKDSSTES